MDRGIARERDRSNAPAFKFDNPGDEVCGQIMSIGQFTGDYGTQTVLVVNDEQHGEVSVYGGSAVLKRKLEELLLTPGDEIDIIFDGLGGRKGNAKLFRVCAERDGEPLQTVARKPTPSGREDDGNSNWRDPEVAI